MENISCLFQNKWANKKDRKYDGNISSKTTVCNSKRFFVQSGVQFSENIIHTSIAKAAVRITKKEIFHLKLNKRKCRMAFTVYTLNLASYVCLHAKNLFVLPKKVGQQH